jgi:hypothetical protein
MDPSKDSYWWCAEYAVATRGEDAGMTPCHTPDPSLLNQLPTTTQPLKSNSDLWIEPQQLF